MAPMKAMKAMKAMKGVKAMTKGAVAECIADKCEMKKAAASKVLEALSELITKEVVKTGKFILPGVCMIKTKVKPATKAGTRNIFGKDVKVKAKPAKTVVKAFPVAALKQSV